MQSYQEHFNFLPRAVLECSAREQILPECEHISLHHRLRDVESRNQNLVLSLEQRERDCVSLQRQVTDLRGSHSWKVTAPVRALSNFFRPGAR